MPIATVKAFVLGTAPLAEQDRQAFLLTERGELQKVIAPGALKAKNRFGSLLELFSCSDFVYYWREDRAVWTLSKGDLLVSRFQALSEPDNLFCAVFMAEALWRFHPHQQQNPKLFRLLDSLLGVLDDGPPLREMLPYFLVWLLRLEGLLFSAEKCSSCDGPLAEAGGWLRDDGRGLLCRACRRSETVHFAADWLHYVLWTRQHRLDAGTVRETVLSGRPGFAALIDGLKRLIEIHGEFRFKTPLV